MAVAKIIVVDESGHREQFSVAEFASEIQDTKAMAKAKGWEKEDAYFVGALSSLLSRRFGKVVGDAIYNREES